MIPLFMVLSCSDDDKNPDPGPGPEPEPIEIPEIKGTFIAGIDSVKLDWTAAQWEAEFRVMKNAGMKYIVIPTAIEQLDGDTLFSWYPSSIPNVKQRSHKKDTRVDLIDLLLSNAQKSGMKAFIGIYNSPTKWWSMWDDVSMSKVDEKAILEMMELGNQVIDELIAKYKTKYPDAFYGWHWPWRVSNTPPFHYSQFQEIMAKALNTNLDHINQVSLNMPMMITPEMAYSARAAENYKLAWTNTLSLTNFRKGDIFALKDGPIDYQMLMELLPEWYSAINEAVKTKEGLVFWSNVDMISGKDRVGNTFNNSWIRMGAAASPGRVITQMAHVQPYVEGYMFNAYSPYYSPDSISPKVNEYFVKNATTLTIPECNEPEPVIGLHFEIISDNAFKVIWAKPNNIDQIMGYRIYKEDKLLADLQYNSKNQCQTEYIIKEDGKINTTTPIEVCSYTFCGTQSSMMAIIPSVDNKE